MTRRISILAGLILLGGCNVVVTKTPLFTVADEAGAPALRSGVWRAEIEPACQVDEARPLADWPSCGDGVVFGRGEAAFFDRKTTPPAWTRQPFVFAAGDPRIAQALVAVSGDFKLDANPYVYAGARATRLDEQGRIVGLVFWPVQCGPPKAGAANGDITTQHPLPGMAMKRGDPVCLASSVSALRGAARASEAWAEKTVSAHWVRDGAS